MRRNHNNNDDGFVVETVLKQQQQLTARVDNRFLIENYDDLQHDQRL